MVYTHFGRVTKQWWGATHLRIGSRGQPRPNKGFRVSHFPTVGSALECCRWWKYLRRGTLARLLNAETPPKPGTSNPVTSAHIEKVEQGSLTLNDEQLSLLSSYLGVNFTKTRVHRYRRNINSENLISSLLIREQEPVQDVPPPSSQEPVDPEETDNHHRLMVFISLLSVLGSIIVFNLFFNLHPLNANKASERDDSALNHIGTFSTYYTGEYEICETARSIKGPSDGRTYNPGSCIRGNMHATAIFREMALDSFTTVYLLFCFELPAGNTFEFWKSPKYGKNTFKRDRRVYMGLSGLEFTNRIDTLYLSGMSSVLGPFTSRAPLKQYWPKEALKLDIWNEYFGKASGAVCSFNTFLRQPFPNMNQVSLRQLDEFYILGIRRYMLKDFEHLSNLDSSKFNIFNALYAEPTPPEYSVADNMAMPQDFIPTEKTENGESKRLVDTMYGSINSTDCGITISFKGQERDMSYGDILVYRFSVVFIMKSLLETFLLCKQLKRVDEGVHGQTISIIAFSMFSYQDLLEIFILLYHRSIFLKSVTCLCFSIFIKLFMVGVVDHSFLVLIWRANHAEQIREGWEATQKRFTLFYRYYFSFLLLQALAWYFYYISSPWVFIATYLCWIPQILLDAWRGQCSCLNILTVITISLCRMYVPCYVLMLKESAFTYDVFSIDSGRTNRTVGAYIVVVTLVQLILMCLQRLRGARCFAAWSILPQIYNYVRPWTKLMQDDPQECVICMNTIVHSKGDWSITPCDHLFHSSCLKEWTAIKMECPNCRHALPPMT